MQNVQPIHSEMKFGSAGADECRDTHPAFGVAIVTRSQGTSRSLFQSDLLHSQTITLSFHEADRTRSLSSDQVHPTKQII